MANNFPTIKPSLNLQFANTGILPPDVTFTRASSSGGYYDGKTVVKAEENLFIRSQALNTSPWSGVNVTVAENTVDTTAPDGTSTANKWTAVAGLANHFRTQVLSSVNGATYVTSVYVKQGTHDFIQIYISNGSGFANYDVGSGVVGTNGSVTSSSIIDDGDGWYRCIVVWVATGTNHYSTLKIAETASDARAASWTALGTETLYVWGAQLEQRSSVTAYTPTTTAPITNYIPKLLFAPAGVPVFDHNPTTGEALGLSVWEARTNLLLRSQEFDNAYWAKTRSTISANQVIAPDGTLTMDKLIETAEDSSHICGSTVVSITNGVSYTVTVFAKAAERTFVAIQGNAGGLVGRANYNLTTGALGTVAAGTTASIVNVGNGIYRCVWTRTATSTTTANININIAEADNVTSYTGDGTSGIFIWGAQLEAGAFATPYIPTVASTVARSADVAVMTGVNFSRWYRADEGSFVANALTANTAATGGILSAEDGTANNRMQLRNNSSGVMSVTSVITGSVDVSLTNGSFAANVYKTGAFAYKFNDYAASCDGAAVTTDTVARVPLVNQLVIGGGTSQNFMNGYIKSFQYYPARLTNANLVAVSQ